VTSPNDGIFYYSIAKNLVENFSIYDGTNLTTKVLTPQPGIAIIIAIFLFLFNQYWILPFSIFISAIWIIAIKNLSSALSITIFKNLVVLNNKELIKFLIICILFSSVFLIRISTSFYNESLYIPLQMYLFSKFLLLAFGHESMDRKNEIILFLSFFGIFFRTQHIIFLIIFFGCLFIMKKVRFSYLAIQLILLLAYFSWIISIQDLIFFEVGNLDANIFYDLPDKIFLSINSLALVFNLYFISLKNYFYSIIIITSLSCIYAAGLVRLYKESKIVFAFICSIVISNIGFIFFFIPISYFDDYARFFWFQFIPQTIIFLIGVDSIFYKYKNFSNPNILLLLFMLSPFLLIFNNEINGKIRQLMFFENSLSNINMLDSKWSLSNAIIYSDSLRREVYWVTKKGTFSIDEIFKDGNKCDKQSNNYLITTKDELDLEMLDSQKNIKLYKAC
tara:strand:- start:3826 stop:5169 length:1344 start_codon:yes stop_codon:yes gene_type:complete